MAGHVLGLNLVPYEQINLEHGLESAFDYMRAFWNKHGAIWRFLCRERGVVHLADLKRQHILDLVDHQLDQGMLHSFLLFLQDEGYRVPQSLLRIPSLKQPDRLPKYLTDEQVRALRLAIEADVQTAKALPARRQALLDRATFYLL